MAFLQRHSKRMTESPTKWELSLRKTLSDLHYPFKTQVPVIVREKYGYILDFLLTDYNLVIEADGRKYHSSKLQIKKDNQRARRLLKEGYYILRLTNKQISVYSKEIIDQIIKTKIQLIVNKS